MTIQRHKEKYSVLSSKSIYLTVFAALLPLLVATAAHAFELDSGHGTGGQGILATISSDTSVMAESLSRGTVIPTDATRIYVLQELRPLEKRPGATLAGVRVLDPAAMVRFYRKRNFRPAWLEPPGLTPRAYMLIKALSYSRSEGLNPTDYHLNQIRALTKRMIHSLGTLKVPPPELWARMDLLLTDAFFTYAFHQSQGRVGNPDMAAGKTRKPNLPALLERALNADSFRKELADLPPHHAGYVLLRDALARYRRIAAHGGWPTLSAGPSLRKGDHGKRVWTLWRRLAVTGEMPEEKIGNVFNSELEEAVKAFQRSHGIDDDGVVGKATRRELNVPVSTRIGQIEANMERWRWMPENLGKRYIMVNIAGFWLDVVDDGKTVMSMEAIVGKDYSQTPVFNSRMTYMVLGPSWTVPRTIAVRDKLPLILKNPKYLGKHGYQVLSGWGDKEHEVDPAKVNWSKLNEDYFPYRLRQDPGPSNALGRVKFMFPNPFSVYIHDTPEKWLFNRNRRTFSSGCIRISKPIELAVYLMQDTPDWSRNVILRDIVKWDELAVRLPRPIPIHIQYFTAWVDGDGDLQFRDDIYGRDSVLLAALKNGAGKGANMQVSHTVERQGMRRR